MAVDRDPEALRALLADAGCRTVDFTADDATAAALAARLGVPAVTADRVRAELDVDVEVIAVR